MHYNRLKWVAWLFLLGTPGYIICAMSHICMEGHMKHGPFAWWEWASDGWTIVCYATAGVLAFKSAIPKPRLFGTLVIVLVVFRYLLGSVGGGAFLFELPILIFLVFYSVRLLIVQRRAMAVDENFSSGSPV